MKLVILEFLYCGDFVKKPQCLSVPEVIPRNPLHAGDKASKQGINQIRRHQEVQKRDISGLTKTTYVLQFFFKKKVLSFLSVQK